MSPLPRLWSDALAVMRAPFSCCKARSGAHPTALRPSRFRLARLLHPDKSDVPETQAAFVKLQEAHGVLMDSSKRSEHNGGREGGSHIAPQRLL